MVIFSENLQMVSKVVDLYALFFSLVLELSCLEQENWIGLEILLVSSEDVNTTIT